MLDIEKIRKDFPILSREIYGRPLVYLDNGATTQKPLCVLDAMRDEYLNVNANVVSTGSHSRPLTSTRRPARRSGSSSTPVPPARSFLRGAQRRA